MEEFGVCVGRGEMRKLLSVLVAILTGYPVHLGRGFSSRTERGWEKVAGSMGSGC